MKPYDFSYGILLLLFFLLMGLTGCAQPQRSPVITDFPVQLHSTAYHCPDGSLFQVTSDGNRARVLHAGGEMVLTRTVSASGEKYQGDASLFWSRGESAQFEISNKLFLNCSIITVERSRLTEALPEGLSIRATGNEPGWLVEVTTQKMVVLTDYGLTRREFTTPAALYEPDGNTLRYLVTDGEQQIELMVREELCQDNMSGDIFPAQASLTVDGTTRPGCASIR